MDNSTMNSGNYEVETEVSGAGEVTQEVSFEAVSAGPSKGFIAGCVGVGAAAIAGIVIAVRQHKRKEKAKALEPADEDYEDCIEEIYDEDEPDEVEAGAVEPK